MTSLLLPLGANLLLATLLWLVSVARRNASLVDLLWPVFFAVAAILWIGDPGAGVSTLAWLPAVIVVLWALRLHAHLLWRNLGEPEDRRYQAIRARHPGFWWKSLFIVFWLQAIIAWVVSLVIRGAIQQAGDTLTPWLAAGAVLAVAGLLWESIADWQLARFKADPANRGRVLDHGLWRYSRHPNYFGESCVWWGLWLMALPGHGWTLFAPLLMTFLLLRVSGVSLLEQDIGDRRPEYARYRQRTSAFIPRPPRGQTP